MRDFHDGNGSDLIYSIYKVDDSEAMDRISTKHNSRYGTQPRKNSR